MYGFGQGNCSWGLGTLRSQEDGWVAIDYSGIGHLLRMSKGLCGNISQSKPLDIPKTDFYFSVSKCYKVSCLLFRVLATNWIVYSTDFFLQEFNMDAILWINQHIFRTLKLIPNLYDACSNIHRSFKLMRFFFVNFNNWLLNN